MTEFNAIGSGEEARSEDFTMDIEPQPTWCPGCGDFAVLNALKGAAADLGRDPEEILVVSGIGCSSKINSYFDSYGFHSIHGRALPLGRAAKLVNDDLEVIAAGGDGDGYGIGGNHFTHTARENHDMTYIVFNNEVFGLTKGQSSPTSPKGHVSKTQLKGVAKDPVRPLALALSAGASYIARTAATNPNQAREILAEAIEHDGFAHVDFLTQCPTWNKEGGDYVPYIDIQEADDYDFDETDRVAAGKMMHEAEQTLYDGKILTGRFYLEEERPTYQEEKKARGEMPETPVVRRYFEEDYDWERSYDRLDRHT
ncbi:MAG: thiamine pyrophosphate-dependent enzyme [Halodesulfurarchaeum sp.]